MLRYFIKRLLGMIPTLIIVAVCVFFFIHLRIRFFHFQLVFHNPCCHDK